MEKKREREKLNHPTVVQFDMQEAKQQNQKQIAAFLAINSQTRMQRRRFYRVLIDSSHFHLNELTDVRVSAINAMQCKISALLAGFWAGASHCN